MRRFENKPAKIRERYFRTDPQCEQASGDGAADRGRKPCKRESREFPEAEGFEEYEANELTAVNEVAAPEAAWFARETEEPLEAAVAHPERSLGDPAGVEIEGCADADKDGDVERGAVFEHPALLLGGAEADPDNVRSGSVDHRDSGGVFVRSLRAKWRTEESCSLQSGETGGEADGESFRDSRRTAIEEMAIALRRSCAAKGFHELGTIDATAKREALAAAEPDEGKAVGDGEAGAVENGLEVGAMLGLHEAVHVRDGDVAAGGALQNRGFDVRDDVWNLHGGNADTENMEEWEFASSRGRGRGRGHDSTTQRKTA